jgi:hypothetical protein
MYSDCEWYDYAAHSPKMLFQHPFCHPTNVDSSTTAADWEACITHDNTTCPESTGQCAYDLGLDLQPVNKEYCAPTMLTSNVSVIMECTSAQDEQSCMPGGFNFSAGMPPCMWRRGIVRVNNTVVDTANRALFETNFCHPPSTKDFNYTYATCVGFNDEQSCEQNQCSWSTMVEFLPV